MADFFILPISDPMIAASHPLLPAHPVPEGVCIGPSPEKLLARPSLLPCSSASLGTGLDGVSRL